MELRWYQEECVQAVYNYFATNTGNPICALPTASGKSVVIAEMIRRIYTTWPTQRIMMLTHVKELIEQNYATLLRMWPMAPAGVFSAGLGRREVRPITFAGIQSVVPCAASFGHIDLLLIDECHLVSPKENTNYADFIDELKKKNPKLKVIGFSATPYRLGQGMLTDPIVKKDKVIKSLFTDVCYNLTDFDNFNRLIDEGLLCTLVPRRTEDTIDTSSVHIVGGEFNQGELQAAVDKEEITRRACAEMLSKGADRSHWLIFATGVEHTEHVANQLESMGVSAKPVHSKLAPGLRDQYLAAFKQGEIRAVVNNNVLTTGFDFPAIDLIGMLRPTTSPGLWVQMLGRGVRPSPGKTNCLVLDFAGNTKRLGPINDPITPKKRGSGGGGGAPVKLCDACGTYNHISARFCCSCKAEFQIQVNIKERASTEELIAKRRKEDDVPIMEWFDVSTVEYSVHFPKGLNPKPPSLKVSYICGIRSFTEYICLEHEGFASKVAREWWRLRTGKREDVPETTAEAIKRIGELMVTSKVYVWANCERPQVKNYKFSNGAQVIVRESKAWNHLV